MLSTFTNFFLLQLGLALAMSIGGSEDLINPNMSDLLRPRTEKNLLADTCSTEHSEDVIFVDADELYCKLSEALSLIQNLQANLKLADKALHEAGLTFKDTRVSDVSTWKMARANFIGTDCPQFICPPCNCVAYDLDEYYEKCWNTHQWWNKKGYYR